MCRLQYIPVYIYSCVVCKWTSMPLATLAASEITYFLEEVLLCNRIKVWYILYVCSKNVIWTYYVCHVVIIMWPIGVSCISSLPWPHRVVKCPHFRIPGTFFHTHLCVLWINTYYFNQTLFFHLLYSREVCDSRCSHSLCVFVCHCMLISSIIAVCASSGGVVMYCTSKFFCSQYVVVSQ